MENQVDVQTDLPRSIADRMRPEPNSGCWLCTGNVDVYGYGRVKIQGRLNKAHRVVYEHLVGDIQPGLHLDHLCRNPACVNPGHLEPVTGTVNVLRGVGVTAINFAKTHCIRGHEFSGEN